MEQRVRVESKQVLQRISATSSRQRGHTATLARGEVGLARGDVTFF